VLVGGQAIWLWTELLRRNSTALRQLGPVSSFDVDFFGFYSTAKQLADAFNAVACKPGADDATPSSAKVEIHINGRDVVVDFIDHVLGITDSKKLRRRAVQLDFGPALGIDNLPLTALHPVHCLISRTANCLSPALQRMDQHSITQLRASYHIARRWIVMHLQQNTAGSLKEAKRSIKELFEWARSSPYARRLAKEFPDLSPVNILSEVSQHSNLDSTYVEKTLRAMIRKLTPKTS